MYRELVGIWKAVDFKDIMLTFASVD